MACSDVMRLLGSITRNRHNYTRTHTHKAMCIHTYNVYMEIHVHSTLAKEYRKKGDPNPDKQRHT